MNGNIFARLTGTKRTLVALLASGAMLTAGCSNMATSSSGGANPLVTSGTLKGQVHGGNQAVSGATVNLYFAGQATNVAATLVATTTTSNDGTGSFTFVQNTTSADNGSDNTFSCPTNVGSPLVYVVAKGGNTLGDGNTSVNNSAAAFIALYGSCNDLGANSFVDMTEVTTVATMAVVQQFFDPSNYSITADGTGQQYNIMLNLPKTVALLANVSNGTVAGNTTIPASTSGANGVGGVSVTASPETNKINTLADAISACVNNASASATACTTLFAAAQPPAANVTNRPDGTVFAPATDVVQATYYILTNPTNGGTTNLSNIYNLATGAGAPYQPTLSAQPTDWNIAINYSSSNTCGSGSGGFISSPYDINIDAQNNVWIANSQATKGNLSQLLSSGAANTCVMLGGASNGGATLDSSGNVWEASTESNNLYRYNPSSQAVTAFPTASTPLAVTADGLGNVYFTSSANTSLYMIPGAATASSAVAPVQISSVVGPNPIRTMPDYQGCTGNPVCVPNPVNIWVSSGAGFVSRVSPATSGPNLLNGYSTTTFSVGNAAYGLAVAANNDVVVSSGGVDNYLVYLSKANSYAPAWTSAAGFAGISNPTGISLDGRANIWVPNNTDPSGTVGGLSEVSAGESALSPTSTGFQRPTAYLSKGRASVVDQAGNVWIIGDGMPNSIDELVGAGVPIFQPYAKGLSNGRFQQVP
ncbi:hypothetical protein [Edaphobacter sp.]|uniref:hypothetical protein n=1 Tax=Edaphobacter sp. TaxID=1934404 RepID=UPI002DBAE2F0|nr:hypothetical protein [Edaphobacter sp.]HEU5339829.1 hypothetical protein [Edaphobacter sp.]